MDVNKNSYTIGFATIMVIIVAALLSSAAIGLKPFQSKNIEQEKKQNILKSVGVEVSREQAEIDYSTYIKEELVVNHLGEIQEGSAFNVDLSKEVRKDAKDQSLPLYVAEVEGALRYIIPLRGKGLWGPIWGFISLEKDLNTISAAVFDHKAETPGLGAEINRDFFQDPFAGKTIFDGEEFKSIKVIKGGAKEGDKHGVDGISGGTITSDGVTDMIFERLSMYLPYFNNVKPAIEVDSVFSAMDSVVTVNDSIIN
ncbi:NADH:ubiquinone reductase (Na(+)-transporting) subunit C [Flavobacteriales bacterium]|jgi:Na+-transporting NADH:ubiquinone oxidoreductase subunit C|nr:NADH:ubiquinone reductase (Na(+)-transporting) subunit C [Flavobacteriales bacterium]